MFGGSFGKNAGVLDFGGTDMRSDFDNSYHGDDFKFRDTISELYDDRDKNAVFRSSMKKGGAMHDFNKKTMKGMNFNPYGSPNREQSPAPKAPSPEEKEKAKGQAFDV